MTTGTIVGSPRGAGGVEAWMRGGGRCRRRARQSRASVDGGHSPSAMARPNAARARASSNCPSASWISASVRTASASASSTALPMPGAEARVGLVVVGARRDDLVLAAPRAPTGRPAPGRTPAGRRATSCSRATSISSWRTCSAARAASRRAAMVPSKSGHERTTPTSQLGTSGSQPSPRGTAGPESAGAPPARPESVAGERRSGRSSAPMARVLSSAASSCAMARARTRVARLRQLRGPRRARACPRPRRLCRHVDGRVGRADGGRRARSARRPGHRGPGRDPTSKRARSASARVSSIGERRPESTPRLARSRCTRERS